MPIKIAKELLHMGWSLKHSPTITGVLLKGYANRNLQRNFSEVGG